MNLLKLLNYPEEQVAEKETENPVHPEDNPKKAVYGPRHCNSKYCR